MHLQAAKKAGLSDDEIQEVLKLSTSQEIKDGLKNATEDALKYGVGCASALLVELDKKT